MAHKNARQKIQQRIAARRARRAQDRAKRQPRKTWLPTKRCGLCGATDTLTKTPCCNNWICDDADQYVLFSYARNSCFRNHDRYTLCSAHDREEHEGTWQKCKKCLTDFDTEMYVWYGTNEYNFETLENPPSFAPTRCVDCGIVISLSEDGYTLSGKGYSCEACAAKSMQK